MSDEIEKEKFDFSRHEQSAVTEYLKVHPFYMELSEVANRVISEAIKRESIQVHSIESRAKEPASFGRKVAKPSITNPNEPKYKNPLKEITDLSAVRIITFFPRTIGEVDGVISTEFSVIEKSDKSEDLIEEEKFGYKSVHYLVKLTPTRTLLPEYERFKDSIVEIQVRTILQHAWAEIEHDIQYKSLMTIPSDIKRRFMSLAGLLEIADREFQAIQDADRDLVERAEAQIVSGNLGDVEITPKSLKTYLDRKIGPDGRMSEFSYDWSVRLVKKLGFTNLGQVDKCIAPYDDDKLSRLLTGGRQGQTTRFEYMLLVGMGEEFIKRHLFADEEWYGDFDREQLEKIRAAGFPIGDYDPRLS